MILSNLIEPPCLAFKKQQQQQQRQEIPLWNGLGIDASYPDHVTDEYTCPNGQRYFISVVILAAVCRAKYGQNQDKRE